MNLLTMTWTQLIWLLQSAEVPKPDEEWWRGFGSGAVVMWLVINALMIAFWVVKDWLVKREELGQRALKKLKTPLRSVK